MPGIVLGEVSSPVNPLLAFWYQEWGYMLDLMQLYYKIYPVGSSTVVDEGYVSLDPSDNGGGQVVMDSAPVGGAYGIPGVFQPGSNIALPSIRTPVKGYYAVTFDPQAKGCVPGPYEIVFNYRPQSSTQESVASYRFEVLDPKHFRAGALYDGYLGSDDPELSEWTVEERQKAIQIVSKNVERLTGRHFFPKYMLYKVTVRPDSPQVWLDQPIIGIFRLVMEVPAWYSSRPTEYRVDVTTVRIFNRHLQGLLSPDDRDDPLISLVGSIVDDEMMTLSKFPWGVKNLVCHGAFGYTEPDGSPFGRVPLQLQQVVKTLAWRYLQDPLGQDQFIHTPGRVASAKTRDQAISFNTRSAYDWSMTGDPRLDNILLTFCRPPHVGVAGTESHR